MKRFAQILFVFILPASLFAQKSLEEVLMLKATVSEKEIVIEWPEDESITSYTISRRAKGAKDWVKLGTVPGSDGQFIDDDVKAHEANEYEVIKETGAQRQPTGYLYSGFEVSEIASHGGIILLIDSTFKSSLATEIDRLEQDLMGEGWTVAKAYAGRMESVVDIKRRIIDQNSAMKGSATALFIIGHVAVPYSGFLLLNEQGFFPPPDGHGDHIGAWPADAYYGDLDGEWTDETAYVENEKYPKNANVPGDGKFDQSKFPSEIELEVGRVDFNDMPAFEKTEEELMKDYFDRNHDWRTGKWQVRERALIDDNFKSNNLALTGHRCFSAMINLDSIHLDLDYLNSQRQGSFLWSYGCGSGSPIRCVGLNGGSSDTAFTKDFAIKELHNVFTITAGSYFGDWNVTDNFLRAPLGNSALINFWGGIPQWYMHHMALGETVGYGAKISQNNFDHFDNGSFNGSWNGTHMALMGDPTLTMSYLTLPSNIKATSDGGDVTLSWDTADGEVDGYNVYRISEDGAYVKANDEIVTSTTYTDKGNWFSGKYTYAVRSVKLETTPSGSYFNVGGGVTAEVDHVNGMKKPSSVNFDLYPNPAHDWLQITLEGTFTESPELSICDVLGKQVVSDRVNHQGELAAQRISIDQLEYGMYVLTIKHKGQILGTGYFMKE